VEIVASCWLPINIFFSLRALYCTRRNLKMSATWYSISSWTAIFTSEGAEFGPDFRDFFFALDIFRDFTPPPRRQSGLHSSVVLRSIDLLLPTLRDNLTVPSLRVSLLKMGMMGCPETSVTSYQPTLRNISEERRFRETWIMQPYCEWFRPIFANKIRDFYLNIAQRSCCVLLSISW